MIYTVQNTYKYLNKKDMNLISGYIFSADLIIMAKRNNIPAPKISHPSSRKTSLAIITGRNRILNIKLISTKCATVSTLISQNNIQPTNNPLDEVWVIYHFPTNDYYILTINDIINEQNAFHKSINVRNSIGGHDKIPLANLLKFKNNWLLIINNI